MERAITSACGTRSVQGRKPGPIIASGQRVAEFEIEELIVGGVSEVYRARDISLDRIVAVKTGSNIKEGPSLAQQLKADMNHRESMPPTSDASRKLDILSQVGAALDFAHSQGIVHRDIKPSNILLCPNGQVKVADFGIAAAIDPGQSSGIGSGTPRYMSPEQAQGKAEAGSDQYSLGVVAHELFIDGDHVPACFRNDPELVEWSVEVEPVMSRATERNASGRFPACRMFVDELSRAVKRHIAQILATSADETLGMLDRMLDKRGFYLAPSIPKSVLARARRLCKVPVSETVLAVAVLDTFRLSANFDCSVIFTNTGIYFCDSKSAGSGSSGNILYSEFVSAEFGSSVREDYENERIVILDREFWFRTASRLESIRYEQVPMVIPSKGACSVDRLQEVLERVEKFARLGILSQS